MKVVKRRYSIRHQLTCVELLIWKLEGKCGLNYLEFCLKVWCKNVCDKCVTFGPFDSHCSLAKFIIEKVRKVINCLKWCVVRRNQMNQKLWDVLPIKQQQPLPIYSGQNLQKKPPNMVARAQLLHINKINMGSI